jgi:hypothetical protein
MSGLPSQDGGGDGGPFGVRVEEGPPRGGLHELEIETRFVVVDRRTGREVLSRSGLYEASFEDGVWGEARLSGVREVVIAPDGAFATVRRYDGTEERVALPGQRPVGASPQARGSLSPTGC